MNVAPDLVCQIEPLVPARPLKGTMPSLTRGRRRGGPRGGQVKRILAFLARLDQMGRTDRRAS